jgi:YVTN family beta-propeller protein
VVDIASRREVAEIPVGRRPWGIAISGDGKLLYTANGGSNDVSVVDVATRRVRSTIRVGAKPWGIALVRGSN